MECDEVKQILDAYVLGALDKEEAKALEEHVAECLLCWAELNEAQRAAAALALAAPLQAARSSLRERLLAAASRSQEQSRLVNVVTGLRSLWPLGMGALAVAATAAVALVALLFVRVDDLQDESAALETQMDNLRQAAVVRAAPDLTPVTLSATAALPQAEATFYWSESTGKGVLVCNNLEVLGPSEMYQVWVFSEGQPFDAGDFQPWQGLGYWLLDLRSLRGRDIDAIIVTVKSPTEQPAVSGDIMESALGGQMMQPPPSSGQMILLGTFPEDR